MKKILVTGGAGYIGGFMVKRLLDEGYEVVVVDSLETGHKEVVDPRSEFVKGDLRDTSVVEQLFKAHTFDAVIHFAAYISMAESMQKPELYFDNNVSGTLSLLNQMKKYTTATFIFSSTAGVYGNPTTIPIPEDHPKNPTNPYGESKFFVERILKWYNVIYGINSVVLRYFNAAGASEDGSLGENHSNESHIIPNIIKAILEKKEFPLFGTDYKTQDGTCVRDYIHVLDLVEAHLLALKHLEQHKGALIYNVGTGKGFSNREVIDMVKKVSGQSLTIVEKQRRPGDADVLIADASKIKQELAFAPMSSDLETIVKTAWEYHKKHNS